MSDSASDVRQADTTPPTGEGVEINGVGSSFSYRTPASHPNDQTIVTGRQPIAAPTASDSTFRILEGRVMPGDRLGHFELIEFVGGGGMGRVFRATDSQLGRTVAIKVLPPEQAVDPDALQRFMNEAQSSARLDHDNIARAYYVGEDRGLHFIAFEFVEGANVRVLVEQKGPLPLAEAVSYTLQIAEALAHADSRAVVHRDIKPSNVLITPEGRVKLIDMGLARLRVADPATADLTASGVTLGTFDYISPEQARDPRNADIRSDIYSLGCTLFFMLSGRPPFPEGTVLQKLLQHQGDQPPDIRQFRPELPDEMAIILRKMMEKDPRQRYAVPTELTADLVSLAHQIGLRPTSSSGRIWLVPPEPATFFFQRHLPWIAPVAVLVCTVVLLDVIWSFSAKHDEQSSTASAIDGSPRALNQAKAPAVQKVKSPQKTPSASKQKAGAEGGAETDSPSVEDLPLSASSGEVAGSGNSRDGADVLANVLVVSDSPKGDNQFSTLAAACGAARDGDVVELRYNGSRDERPVRISNIRLTVRAGDGYKPVPAFRPVDADEIVHPRGMFTLAAGQLTMSGLALEMHIPSGVPAEGWAMFETRGGEFVRLDRCSLTIVNSSGRGPTYYSSAAFFHSRFSLDGNSSTSDAPSATPLATIELTDVVARGEADFLRVDDLQPVHLSWDNGLLLTSGRLLTVEGGPTAPKPNEVLHIELRHVTAVARGGLCRMESDSANPHQLTVQFISSDNIFITSPGSPLVEQEGLSSVESFRQRFVWSGDRNYYQNIDVFWIMRNIDLETPPEVMNFESWKSYWGASREIQADDEQLNWKHSPNADRPLHAQGPADYTLEDPTFNDASGGAPGFRLDSLPQHLPDPGLRPQNRPGSARFTPVE